MLTSGAFEERRTSEGRILGLRIIFGACFAALAVSFWLLQVVQNAKYEEEASNNLLRTIPLRAPRGVLFDRDNKVLVENRYSFTIAVLREQTKHLDQSLKRVAQITGADEARIRDIVQRRQREPPFRPLPIIEHATFAQVAAVTARHLEMPEIVVQQVPTRSYPAGGLAAHLFGYVGEVQDAQLDSPEFSQLEAGTIIGQAGIERVYNSHLMGTDGNKFIVVNSVGREIEELKKQDPIDGHRMQLTIDYDLQKALEDGFKANGYAGAGVMLDPRTGEILAMTSQPEYDPNDFANGIERTKWNSLTNDPLKPLQDRLIQGRYSPGSTFKILMATAALSEGLITPDYRVNCPGSITLYGHVFHCDKKQGHGSLDLRHAIEQSCDVYFYRLGSMMSIDTIHAYAEKMGLVGKTGIDLPSEVSSLVPSSEWKLRTTGERWYPGETISVAIGQGQVSVTPIALSTMIATVANGGTVVTPHLVKAVDSGSGWQSLAAPAPRSVFPIRPDVLQAVRDGLWLAVNGAGTAGRARVDGHPVAGKTGTAQVVSAAAAKAAGHGAVHLRDNAWFVFYAPADNPTIAGVVFAEHAGWGATAAVPIAHHVLETYFAKLDKRPLPTVTMGADGVIKTVMAQPAAAAPGLPASQPVPPTPGNPAPVPAGRPASQ
ncbi:MAG: penicillin-binding protein 2 [Vicinamibacterales bacterium]